MPLSPIRPTPLVSFFFSPQPAPENPHQTLIIEEFEPDVFRQLIEYIHTGCVTLQPRTLLGEVMAHQLSFACKFRSNVRNGLMFYPSPLLIYELID